ncbi:MAG: hypothetical protein QN229_04375 [Desulfurococcaceae archaeon TW002]
MTYSVSSKDEISEVMYEEREASEDFVDRFGLVLKVDSRGHIADVVVNAPTKVIDPEVIAKVSLIMSVLAKTLLNYVGSQRIEEINVSFNNGMLLIIPEGSEIRVALVTST